MKTLSTFTHFFRGTILSIFFALLSIMFFSCGTGNGENPMVTDVRLASQTNDGDIFVEIDATLDLGNITLPSIQYPVIHPKTSELIGEINLGTTFSGTTELTLSINLTNITRVPSIANSKLPNGLNLPVGGLRDIDVVQIPIADNRAQVYIAMGDGIAMAGVAVVVSGMDQIGHEIGTSGFFPMFEIDDVKGIGGIFTSSNVGQNGLALFVDLSSVIDPQNFLAQSSRLKSGSVFAMRATPYLNSGSQLFFIDQEPGKKQKKKMQKLIYKLHRSRARLNIK